MKTILLYGFNTIRDFGLIGAVSAWAAGGGIKTLAVQPEYYSLPLERILSGEALPKTGENSAHPEKLEARMLVFSEFERRELFAAIDALKPLGVGPDDIKVSVTPTNRSWSGAALCREVVKEHRFMSKKNK